MSGFDEEATFCTLGQLPDMVLQLHLQSATQTTLTGRGGRVSKRTRTILPTSSQRWAANVFHLPKESPSFCDDSTAFRVVDLVRFETSQSP